MITLSPIQTAPQLAGNQAKSGRATRFAGEDNKPPAPEKKRLGKAWAWVKQQWSKASQWLNAPIELPAANTALPLKVDPYALPEVTTQTFEETVLNAKTPVVVKFYATFCGYCKVIAPKVSEIAKANPQLPFVQINASKNRSLAHACNLGVVPTLMVFNEGQIVGVLDGESTSAEITQFIAPYTGQKPDAKGKK